MVEDKTFELLERMYNDFRTELNEIKTGQKKIETTLEHDIKTNLQVLHERMSVNTDKLENHTKKLDKIENNLDYIALSVNAQDKRLEVVEIRKKA